MVFLWEEYIIMLSLYTIPLYLANSLPVLAKGRYPIDFGKQFLGNPLFGEGKTIEGCIVGIVSALIAGVILQTLIPEMTALLTVDYITLATLLGVGAIVGDIIASFFKRRMGIARGESILLLDQLDFIVGGIVFGAIVYLPSIEEIIGLVIVTLIAHKLGNEIAFRARWKKTPW